MSESYQSWSDRELVKDHEADPEPFRQPIITQPVTIRRFSADNAQWKWDGATLSVLENAGWIKSIFRTPAELMRLVDGVTEETA